ncbi:UNKNOWN [Stylonychia lemnae]|uniref:Uncharacterized protein n=1 Tax=Stylonychia lemnae TaxID=5949 RepID=A0A078B537_STYLE|nr:UNKNOWN [Stylonychia lemnae]|eukprot:CDW88357.1 UNKNOWN [Stylonychia lemnae]
MDIEETPINISLDKKNILTSEDQSLTTLPSITFKRNPNSEQQQISFSRNFQSQNKNASPILAYKYNSQGDNTSAAISSFTMHNNINIQSGSTLQVSPSSRSIAGGINSRMNLYQQSQSMITPSRQQHHTLNHDASLSSIKTSRFAVKRKTTAIGSHEDSLTMRKLNKSQLEVEENLKLQLQSGAVTKDESLKEKLKHTLYRVVIRDKEYWQEVENKGGIDQFRPTQLFFDNKIQMLGLAQELQKSSQRSRTIEKEVSLSKPKIDSVLDKKGRINRDMYVYYEGLEAKVREQISNDGQNNQSIKDKIDEITKSFVSKQYPQGASKSMSPYLLANTFKVDFYDLYRGVQEQKEKAKKEKTLKLKQKQFEDARKKQDKKQMKKLKKEIDSIQTELIEEEQKRQRQEELKSKLAQVKGLKKMDTQQEKKAQLLQQQLEEEENKKLQQEEVQEEASMKKGLGALLERNRQLRLKQKADSQSEQNFVNKIDQKIKLLLNKKSKRVSLNATDPQIEEEGLDLDEDLFKTEKQKQKEEKERLREEKRVLIKQLEDKKLDADDRKKIQEKLDSMSKSPIKLKKDKDEDNEAGGGGFNFYDKLINQDQKNTKHDDKLNKLIEEENDFKKNQPTKFLSKDQEINNYKNMMKHFSTNNKKFIDAIRNKVTQELKDFKKAHNLLLKQLATSERKKKSQDNSLAGLNSIFKESNQNQRILNELIQEAQEFDTRLQKMGINISVQDLIGEKESNQSPMANIQEDVAEYELDDDKPKKKVRDLDEEEAEEENKKKNVDYTKIGLVHPDDKSKDYLPVQSKLVPFSDKSFNPLLVVPKAPNKRLDQSKTQEQLRLEQMDLFDILHEVGVLKKNPLKEGSSNSRMIHKSIVISTLKSVLKGKQLINNVIYEKVDAQKELGSDLIIQQFLFEKIINGCQDIVHKRIMSDTQKRMNKNATFILKKLEKLLWQEAREQKIDTDKLEQEVYEELQNLKLMKTKKVEEFKLQPEIINEGGNNDESIGPLNSFKILRAAIVRKIQQMIKEKMTSRTSILSLISEEERFNLVKAQDKQKNNLLPAINLQTPSGVKIALLASKDHQLHNKQFDPIYQQLRSRSVIKQNRNNENLKSLKDYTQSIKNGFISSDVMQFDVNKYYDTVIDLRIKKSFATGRNSQMRQINNSVNN